MQPDPEGLTAGYVYRRRGTSSYRGALRRKGRSTVTWACADDHLTALKAIRCAEAELDRRRQAASSVITLLRCAPCDRWWPDGESTACPVCGVPLERLKLVVTERSPAVDATRRAY